MRSAEDGENETTKASRGWGIMERGYAPSRLGGMGYRRKLPRGDGVKPLQNDFTTF